MLFRVIRKVPLGQSPDQQRSEPNQLSHTITHRLARHLERQGLLSLNVALWPVPA